MLKPHKCVYIYIYTLWIQIFSEKVRLNPLVITPQSYFLKRCGWIQRNLNLVNHISHWFIIQVKTDKRNTNDMVKSTYIYIYIIIILIIIIAIRIIVIIIMITLIIMIIIMIIIII